MDAGKIVLGWALGGYGPLIAVRGITIAMMQTIFASFLMSLMLIRRR
jgi:hypothetical protein